jgi:hypothetical protein
MSVLLFIPRLATLFLSIVGAASAVAQTAEWRTRAGATIELVERDGRVSLRMKDPAGARIPVGALLFEGSRVQGGLNGQAFAFFDGCRPLGYQVRGTFEENGRRLLLEGRSPIQVETDGTGCRPNAYQQRTLTFQSGGGPIGANTAPLDLPRNLGANPADYMTRLAACWPSHTQYAGITTLQAPEATRGTMVFPRSGSPREVACSYRALWSPSNKPELHLSVDCRLPGSIFERAYRLPLEDMNFAYISDATNFSFEGNNEAATTLTTSSPGAVVATCRTGDCVGRHGGRVREVRLPFGNSSIGRCFAEEANRISSDIPSARQALAEQEARERERRRLEQEAQAKRVEDERIAARTRLLSLCASVPEFRSGPWFSSSQYRDAVLAYVSARTQIIHGEVKTSWQFTAPILNDGQNFACVDTIEYIGALPNPHGARVARVMVTGKALWTYQRMVLELGVPY